MTDTHKDNAAVLPYRPCVGIMLINHQGLIFTGERLDTPGAWQMPQGGIDAGEHPKDAALRELSEETGIPAALVTVLAWTKDDVLYDLPDHLIGKLWGGNYRGQRQIWFALRFTGNDSNININTAHPEFSRWRWSTRQELISNIVDFKRDIYTHVLDEFSGYLEN